MKILTWNINGIRASKLELKKLFDSLDADIICLQETKVTRDMLDEPTAIVEGYNAYFSFSKKRSGYSGVATYCRDSATPVGAEEGLSGLLVNSDEGSIGCHGDMTSFTDDELESLDAEGRAVITQHQIRNEDGKTTNVAIINVYCPRVDPEREDRHIYKLRFFALLQTRAEALVNSGSHVVVLGDMNVSHKLIDVAEPQTEDFVKKPSRMWLNQFLWEEGRDKSIESVTEKDSFLATTPHSKGGMFIDTFRHLYPQQTDAYTNWCMVTAARQTNYGRRLDYIFGDTELVKDNLMECVIMPEVDGSDHCPVKVELTCTVVPPSKCPPLCTKWMPEFAGKQQKLLAFFSKKVGKSEETPTVGNKDAAAYSMKNSPVKKVIKTDSGQLPSSGDKRHLTDKTGSLPLSKRKKTENSKQGNLMNFFTKQNSKSETAVTQNVKSPVMTKTEENDLSKLSQVSNSKTDILDTELTSSQGSSMSDSCEKSSSQEKINEENKTDVPQMVRKTSAQAWKSLLGGPPPPPPCKGHKEPCVLRMVKKDGPNKGKQFFVCARPEGHATNLEARCDHFQWVEKKKK